MILYTPSDLPDFLVLAAILFFGKTGAWLPSLALSFRHCPLPFASEFCACGSRSNVEGFFFLQLCVIYFGLKGAPWRKLLIGRLFGVERNLGFINWVLFGQVTYDGILGGLACDSNREWCGMVVSPHEYQTGAMVFDLVGMQIDVAGIFFLSPYPEAYLENVGLHQKSIYSLIYHHVAAT